jgi:hypothetical protein
MQQVNYWSHILHSSNTLKKLEYSETLHQFFIEFKKACDSVRRGGGLYNILIESGIPKKLVRLIKMCLTETYSYRDDRI